MQLPYQSNISQSIEIFFQIFPNAFDLADTPDVKGLILNDNGDMVLHMFFLI